jgi:hypothetical protein
LVTQEEKLQKQNAWALINNRDGSSVEPTATIQNSKRQLWSGNELNVLKATKKRSRQDCVGVYRLLDMEHTRDGPPSLIWPIIGYTQPASDTSARISAGLKNHTVVVNK